MTYYLKKIGRGGFVVPNTNIEPDRLVAFLLESISRSTALNYIEEMKNAKTPFVTVEWREDGKFNVIGGFKYVAGVRLLNSSTNIFCNIVEPFKTEKERKLAILQRCLIHNEYNIKYKEVLIYDLIKNYKMNEKSISHELGQSADKIKKYMYKQIIPNSYFDKAERLGIKPLLQAIFLTNSYSSHEKLILAELSLEQLFKIRHMTVYNRYRSKYRLFDDITLAKEQVLKAVMTEQATFEYWESISHPFRYNFGDRDVSDNITTH
jgi:hypothetical protein